MGDEFIKLVNTRDFLKLAELGVATAGVQIVAGCTVAVVTATASIAGCAIKNAVDNLKKKQAEDTEDNQEQTVIFDHK